MIFNVAHAASENVANADATVSAGSGLASFVPMLLILVVFYFLLLRPQMKKQKELNNMISSLKSGDKVVAAGGIMGTVVKIEDDVVHLEISKDNVIKVLKQSIADKVNKDTVAKSAVVDGKSEKVQKEEKKSTKKKK
jgi:preprotein translocase subunit YajC